MEFYNTIAQEGQTEFKDRGSKFIAYARSIKTTDEFKLFLKALKQEHPKAVHHCFAYRLGLDGNQYRVSDDGEPSGSAGKPIMGQIDSKQLTDVCIIIVRYFGGTLLGVPGLINAYKTAASLVLQVVPIVQKPVLVNYALEFDYTCMNDVQIILRHTQAQIISQEALLFCNMQVGVPHGRQEEFVYRIQNLRNVSHKRIL